MLFPEVLKTWRSKTKALADSVIGESVLPGLETGHLFAVLLDCE